MPQKFLNLGCKQFNDTCLCQVLKEFMCEEVFYKKIIFNFCSAKVAEEKIRYATYNCVDIDTDMNVYED